MHFGTWNVKSICETGLLTVLDTYKLLTDFLQVSIITVSIEFLSSVQWLNNSRILLGEETMVLGQSSCCIAKSVFQQLRVHKKKKCEDKVLSCLSGRLWSGLHPSLDLYTYFYYHHFLSFTVLLIFHGQQCSFYTYVYIMPALKNGKNKNFKCFMNAWRPPINIHSAV